MSTDKTVVVISRQWKSPEITVRVTQEGINISMPVGEFVESLAAQVGNPTMLFTNEQLRKKMVESCNLILEEMKDASKHGV